MMLAELHDSPVAAASGRGRRLTIPGGRISKPVCAISTAMDRRAAFRAGTPRNHGDSRPRWPSCSARRPPGRAAEERGAASVVTHGEPHAQTSCEPAPVAPSWTGTRSPWPRPNEISGCSSTAIGRCRARVLPPHLGPQDLAEHVNVLRAPHAENEDTTRQYQALTEVRRDSGNVEFADMKALAVCAAALVFASPAIAALPKNGTFEPGRSLSAGSAWARTKAPSARRSARTGVCIGCATSTWYFNYKPFSQRGLAVEFTRGRVSGVYTLWQPTGWRASEGPAARCPRRTTHDLDRAACRGRLPRLRRACRRRVEGSFGLLRRPGEALGLRTDARPREPVPLIELGDVQTAARRLHGLAHRTPVLTSRISTASPRLPRRESGALPTWRRVQVPWRVQ